MSKQLPVRPFPCNECPVRRDNADNPRSKFPAERWRQLRETIDGIGPSALRAPLFGCHKGVPGEPEQDLACAGWMASFGHRSIPIRLAVVQGRLDPARLGIGPDWPELYDTWDEMAAVQQWNPGDPDDHLPQACRTGAPR